MYQTMMAELSLFHYYQQYTFWIGENLSVGGRIMTHCSQITQVDYTVSFPHHL